MFTRHPRDTATGRACVNNSGRFQNALVVLLILCLYITSAKALRLCVDGKPEEGLNACPCVKGRFGHFMGRRSLDGPLAGLLDMPALYMSRLNEPLFPVGSEGLTQSEKCELTRRCDSRPQCCVDLCGSNPGMICETETDCRTIRDGNIFWACVAQRKCLQWNDSRCTEDSARYNRDGVLVVGYGTHCFCRKYSQRCSDLV